MKKKFSMMLLALTMSATSFAQFEQGKKYVSTSLSGANLHFTGAEKWKFDLNAKVGYMIEDNWMALAQLEYGYRKYEPNTLMMGVGARYYIVENGLFLGAGANYCHRGVVGAPIDDFIPTVHIGYAFFINKTVTIEPEFYYNQSLKDHSNFSDVGIRIGLGLYLDEIFGF